MHPGTTASVGYASALQSSSALEMYMNQWSAATLRAAPPSQMREEHVGSHSYSKLKSAGITTRKDYSCCVTTAAVQVHNTGCVMTSCEL